QIAGSVSVDLIDLHARVCVDRLLTSTQESCVQRGVVEAAPRLGCYRPENHGAVGPNYKRLVRTHQVEDWSVTTSTAARNAREIHSSIRRDAVVPRQCLRVPRAAIERATIIVVDAQAERTGPAGVDDPSLYVRDRRAARIINTLHFDHAVAAKRRRAE